MQRLTTVFRYAIVFAVMLSVGALSAFATGRITGKVTDDDTKAALGGVSIKVKVGSKVMGAFSGKDGNYEIRNVPAGSYEITASYIGFKAQNKKITVTDDADVAANFNMQLDLLLLEEAVVIGYGTKQRKDITGSISSINAKEMRESSLPSFEQMMQGRAAGVQIIASNGMPGSPVSVRVRGTGSINASSEPLYVIDGVPMTTGSLGSNFRTATETNALSDLNPNDIESIEVLKDADASAIYGARGANGVVLITTKRGQAGTTRFNASYMTGWSNVSNRPAFYDGPGWLGLWNEANVNDSVASGRGTAYRRPRLPFNIGTGAGQIAPANTNWLDQVLQTGRIDEANVSAAGGTEKTRFFAGATYRTESGYHKQSSLERISGRLNLDHNATEDLTVGFGVSITRNSTDRAPVAWAGGMGWAQSSALPIFPINLPNGDFFQPTNFGANPVSKLQGLKFNQASTRTLANGYGEYRFNSLGIPGLALRVEGGLDRTDLAESYFESDYIRSSGQSFSELRNVTITNWNTNTTLNYNAKFGDVHSLGVLAGMSVNRSDLTDIKFNGRDFPNPYFQNPTSAGIKDGGANSTAYSFVGYFARIDYKLMERYMLKLSVRRDASSRFGADTRFGLFPAVGAGWVISEEDFLKNNETVSLLKLRGSIGLTGNAEIGDFDRFGTYSAGANYNDQAGTRPDRLDNRQLGWEQATMTDVGVDFALWQGRVSGTVAYYNKNTSNLLLRVQIPASAGYATILQNIGAIRNSGLEFSFSSKNLVGDFTWSTDFNIAFNRNVVTENAGLAPDAIAGPGETRILVGYPIGTFFINKFASVQPTTGLVAVQRRSADNQTAFDPRTADQRGNTSGRWIDTMVTVRGGSPLYYNLNGKITDVFDLKDRQPLGQPYPTAVGGLTNTFSYKGFDLTVLVNYSFGGSIYDDAAKRQVGNVGFNWNQRVNETEQRWKKEGDVATVPRLTLTENRDVNIDRWIYDGSFIRLRQVTIGYRLPSELTQSFGVESIRIYGSAQNLFTWTNYPGWDPEIQRDQYAAQGANLGASVTYLTPPQAKVFTVGISVGF